MIAERSAQHALIFLKIRQISDNLLALLNDARPYLQALERGWIFGIRRPQPAPAGAPRSLLPAGVAVSLPISGLLTSNWRVWV